MALCILNECLAPREYRNTMIGLLMTSIDHKWPQITSKMKIFLLLLYALQKKARNPGKTVAATNPVFDLPMTSNDL